MKKIFVFVFLTTFSAAYIQAQKVGTANNRSELPEQIWLENSEGKTITSSGASVDRAFFFAKWVAVKSMKQLSDKERVAIIIQPDTGIASAHFCIKSNLSHQALADLSAADPDAKITFCITEKSASKPSTSFSAIQIILK